MTHTNFQKLRLTDPEQAAESAAATAATPLIPQQRSGEHDYFDAYADVHALMLEIAGDHG